MSDFEIKGPGLYVTRDCGDVDIIASYVQNGLLLWVGASREDPSADPDFWHRGGEHRNSFPVDERGRDDIITVHVPTEVYDPRETSPESQQLRQQLELCVKYGHTIEIKGARYGGAWDSSEPPEWRLGSLYRIAQQPAPPPQPTIKEQFKKLTELMEKFQQVLDAMEGGE